MNTDTASHEAADATAKKHPGAPRKQAEETDAPIRRLGEAAPAPQKDPADVRRVAHMKSRSPKLTGGDFALADQVRNIHHIKPDAGIDIEQVLRPEFLAHVAAKLRPLDEIIVNPKDGAYYAVLQVRSASRIEAVCEVLLHKTFAPLTRLAQSEEKMFVTRYGSPATQWQVLRASDKLVVAQDFVDEATALRWLDGHLKSLAA